MKALRRALKVEMALADADAATLMTPQHSLAVRSYIIHMAAISLGLKVADNTRRIVQYTRPHQRHKQFFSLARGFFPVQELCGAMTALALARRDVLGLGGWDITSLVPAIVLHATATLRGMKPFVAWRSDRPWDELQLQAWNAADESNTYQLFVSGSLNLLWLLALARIVLHLCSRYSSLEHGHAVLRHLRAPRPPIF